MSDSDQVKGNFPQLHFGEILFFVIVSLEDIHYWRMTVTSGRAVSFCTGDWFSDAQWFETYRPAQNRGRYESASAAIINV